MGILIVVLVIGFAIMGAMLYALIDSVGVVVGRLHEIQNKLPLGCTLTGTADLERFQKQMEYFQSSMERRPQFDSHEIEHLLQRILDRVSINS